MKRGRVNDPKFENRTEIKDSKAARWFYSWNVLVCECTSLWCGWRSEP